MGKAAEKTGEAKAGAAVEKMNFEEALAELEGIVSRMERGDVPLEQSIAIYERGEALKKQCENLLRAAEEKIEKIRLDSDGTPRAVENLD